MVAALFGGMKWVVKELYSPGNCMGPSLIEQRVFIRSHGAPITEKNVIQTSMSADREIETKVIHLMTFLSLLKLTATYSAGCGGMVGESRTVTVDLTCGAPTKNADGRTMIDIAITPLDIN